MKKIDTLIHPTLWDDARAVLETIGEPVTLREVRTFGRTPPKREVYRGSAYFLDVTPELELTALVDDDRVESTIAALESIGKNLEITVSSVEHVVHRGRPAQAAVRVLNGAESSAPALGLSGGGAPAHGVSLSRH